MKNLLIAILTVLAVIAVTTVVFAADTEVPLGAEIPEERYTVTIPDDELTLSVTANTTRLNFAAEEVLLFKGNTLKVSVNSANDYDLVCESGETVSRIPYKLILFNPDVGNEIITGKDFLLVEYEGIGTVDEAYSKNVNLIVSLCGTVEDAVSGGAGAEASAREALNEATLAGKHTDTLTFTCEVVSG